MVFEFSWCQLELKGPNYFWYDRQEWTPEDLKRELFSSHEMAGDRGWFGVCTENHDQPRSIDHYLPREGRNYYGATMLASMYLLLRGTPYVYQGQEIGMENMAFSSIEELISEGTFAPAYREEKNLIAYRRRFEGKALLVLCNMQPEERELKLSAAYRQVLADNYKEAAFTGNTVRLRPYEVLIAEEA